MLKAVKAAIKEQQEFIEASSLILGDLSKQGDLDDAIVLGESHGFKAFTEANEESGAEGEGMEMEESEEEEDSDADEDTDVGASPVDTETSDKPAEPEDLTDTPIDAEGEDGAEGSAPAAGTGDDIGSQAVDAPAGDDSVDIADAPIDTTPVSSPGEEPLPLPGIDLPDTMGRQTGLPAQDDNIVDVNLDLQSNTLRDILPVPPSSAAQAVDSDTMDTHVDSGFGKASGDVFSEPIDSSSMMPAVENTIAYREALDIKGALQSAGKAIADGARNFGENIASLWRWIVRGAKYLRDTYLRRKKLKKAEKAMEDAERILDETGQAVINVDDLDGIDDKYKQDGFFEATAETGLTVFGDVTVTDLAKFSKSVLLNKKMVMNAMAVLTPGVGQVKAGIEAAKMVGDLVPIVADFIVTSKEVALLRKKYAGKTRKLRDENGNVYMEMPAEAYITIDRYVNLAKNIVEHCAQGGKKEKITLNISSTDDLIKIGRAMCGRLERLAENGVLEKVAEMVSQTQGNASELAQGAPTDEARQAITAISTSYKPKANEMTQYDAISQLIGAVCDSMSMALGYYIDGEEYRINGKEITAMMAPYISQFGQFAIEFGREVNEIDMAGQNCLQLFCKIMKIAAPKIAKIGSRAASDAIKRGVDLDDNKRFLIKAHESAAIFMNDDIFSEAITLSGGDDAGGGDAITAAGAAGGDDIGAPPADPTGGDMSADLSGDAGGEENAVTAAVRDKVSESEEDFSDDESNGNTKDDLLKKLGNITKSLEDAKKAIMDKIQ